MIIKIGGVETDYQVNSLDIDSAIGSRSTASFSIVDMDGSMNFQKGQQVQIIGKSPISVLKKWSDEDLTVTWGSEL